MNKELSDDKPIFPANVVIEILKIHRGTLKVYNEEGLLIPSGFIKNRKIYSLSDIKKGYFIQYLARELKVSLSGIKIIFSLLKRLEVNPNNYMNYILKIIKDS